MYHIPNKNLQSLQICICHFVSLLNNLFYKNKGTAESFPVHTEQIHLKNIINLLTQI